MTAATFQSIANPVQREKKRRESILCEHNPHDRRTTVPEERGAPRGAQKKTDSTRITPNYRTPKYSSNKSQSLMSIASARASSSRARGENRAAFLNWLYRWRAAKQP